ncbi:hypothetical protein BO71DRAFT_437197 [Aspergillus ellipticus CBS 707.79]|uniref:Uncharacterized protein n=1 Tax=Aspergillus ellipticus CBS 707.79 TaxID=1448320 RepID=A0A319DPL7_9EURO|nr:hypothetical protein BO71DRAFT_437197 [Aspergillus ellipticus CBS 707.79]
MRTGILALTMATLSIATSLKEETLSHIRQLQLDPEGFVHAADDGVVRSFRPDAQVVDYIKLNETQLMSVIPDLAFHDADFQAHLVEVWTDVDGNDVDDEQALHPSEELLPPRLRAGYSAVDDPAAASPSVAARAALEKKTLFCAGRLCSTSYACQYMRCSLCIAVDMYIPTVMRCI